MHIIFAERVFPKVLSLIVVQSQHGWSFLVKMSRNKSSNWPRKAWRHHRLVSLVNIFVYLTFFQKRKWVYLPVDLSLVSSQVLTHVDLKFEVWHLGFNVVKLKRFLMEINYFRCHLARLPRCGASSFRDGQQNFAYFEEERPGPRAARRFVLFDQESCGHPQAFGA